MNSIIFQIQKLQRAIRTLLKYRNEKQLDVYNYQLKIKGRKLAALKKELYERKHS